MSADVENGGDGDVCEFLGVLFFGCFLLADFDGLGLFLAYCFNRLVSLLELLELKSKSTYSENPEFNSAVQLKTRPQF